MSDEGEKPKEGTTPVPVHHSGVCNKACKDRTTKYQDMVAWFCKQFAVERYCSLIASVVGTVLMVVCMVFAIRNSKLTTADITTLTLGVVGSGGFISLGVGLLFKFMDKANDSVTKVMDGSNESA